MYLSRNPSDAEILHFIESWVDDLVQENYAGAFHRTEHEPYYQWTPELMRDVIHGYGLPDPDGPIFHVTPRHSAQGKPSVSIYRGENMKVYGPAIAVAFYNLPLNGQWSDLTATFRFDPHDKGSVAVLQEIHVF